MKILLIDDDEALAMIFGTALKKQGFAVSSANTGKNGLEMAKAEQPDFILLDQILPDMKGNDVLISLKEDLDTSHIPIAMLSNYGQTELVQDAINHGAVDYILKYQVEPQDLVNKVQELMKENPPKTEQPQ
jgi:DNA-binding response OmpR family regulator